MGTSLQIPTATGLREALPAPLHGNAVDVMRIATAEVSNVDPGQQRRAVASSLEPTCEFGRG
jgi:hypothetical protein